MKIWFTMMLACFCAIAVAGTPYDSLWKKVQDNIKKDLPKSAKTELLKIQQLAEKHNDKEQLLRSEIYLCNVQGQIAPDSLEAEVQRMKRMADAQKSGIWQKLWAASLAQVYLHKSWEPLDTAAQRKVQQWTAVALSDMPLLSRKKATDYPLLFNKTPDSRYFHDDVLHILLETFVTARGNAVLNIPKRLAYTDQAIQVYQRRKWKDATLMMQLQKLRMQEEGMLLSSEEVTRQLLQLKAQNAAQPANVETYIALVNLRNSGRLRMSDADYYTLLQEGIAAYAKQEKVGELQIALSQFTSPLLSVRSEISTLYPGQTVNIVAKGRHMKTAHLEVYRLNMTTPEFKKIPTNNKEQLLKGLSPLTTLTFRFPDVPPYAHISDSVRYTFNQAGIYLLRLQEAPHDLEWVHVTQVYPLVLQQNDGINWARIVDRRTGHLLPDGKWMRIDSNEGTQYPLNQLQTGKANPLPNVGGWNNFLLPYTDTDMYGEMMHLSGASVLDTVTKKEVKVQMYTDRGIYRAGQKINVGVVLYSQYQLQQKVVPQKELLVTLTDDNGQLVQHVQVKTDVWGTAAATLSIPQTILAGTARINVLSGNETLATRHIQIDAYKRPTFDITLLPPAGNYVIGDSVVLNGTVKMLNGLPLAHAQVHYALLEDNYWRSSINEKQPAERGVVTTDAQGHFAVQVKLGAQQHYDNNFIRRIYFSYEVAVTASNGETQTQNLYFVAGKTPSTLMVNFPKTICKEFPETVTFAWTNSAGQDLQGQGEATFYYNGERYKTLPFTANAPISMTELAQWPSGAYRVEAVVGKGVKTKAQFLLFSQKDRQPTANVTLWSYVRESSQKDSVYIMVGTPEHDVQVFYDLYAESGYQEHQSFTCSDALCHINWTYKPVYGNGAQAVWSFVRDGKLYTCFAKVQRPLPEKQLQVKWTSFRSRLLPGQHETWRLSVTNAQGQPVRASLMATMYDAALNRFADNRWHYAPQWQFPLPDMNYLHLYNAGWDLTYRDVRERFPRLNQNVNDGWQPHLFSYYHENWAPVMYSMRDNVTAINSRYAEEYDAGVFEERAMGRHKAAKVNEEKQQAEMPLNGLRKDFAETAFFFPALTTNAQGVASLDFTLPQSMTRWSLQGFVHNAHMDYALIDTVVTSQKPLMVQPNFPRFIREGDRLDIPVTLVNAQNQPIAGKIWCEVRDGVTNQLLWQEHDDLRLKANKQCHALFAVHLTTYPKVLKVVVMGDAAQFADGEEQWIPVLDNQETVLKAVPFSMTQPGELTLSLDSIKLPPLANQRRLVVEMTSNPTWYAVAALPPLVDKACHAATDWTMRYYALSLAQYIARQHPELQTLAHDSAAVSGWSNVLQRHPDLKQVLLAATPWQDEAETEAQRIYGLAQLFDSARQYKLLEESLRQMATYQNADGGFSWFKGMGSSPYITTEIALMLAQQQALTGHRQANALLQKTFAYLRQTMHAYITDRKSRLLQRKQPWTMNETDYRYLYLCALLQQPVDSDVRYLLSAVPQQPQRMSIYGKARTAYVLKQYGYPQAENYLKSMLEYTVKTPEMGMYFDTYTAQRFSDTYQVTSQCAAIDALARFRGTNDADVQQLRLWLLQAKRTQMWQTPTTTADALYALLVGMPEGGTVKTLAQQSPLQYTLLNDKKVVATSTQDVVPTPLAGYLYQSYTGKAAEATAVRIEKKDTGLSWGAALVQYRLPAGEVKASGDALTVTRSWEVWQNGQWQPVGEQVLQVGNRVRQVLTVQAQRDFDFVSLLAARPANVEPAAPLSGYQYDNGQYYYRVVGDTRNEYFFEHLPKGRTVITDEGFVDRGGKYEIGLTRIQCIYAPEFVGHSTSGKLNAR